MVQDKAILTVAPI